MRELTLRKILESPQPKNVNNRKTWMKAMFNVNAENSSAGESKSRVCN